MSQPSITTYEHPEAFLTDVLERFVSLAQQTIRERGVFRVSLSGGSTPQRLYQALVRSGLDLTKVHWFWGDERNVPHDHSDSNYRMVAEALLNPGEVPPSAVFAVPVDPDDPAKAARQYESTLRAQFAEADRRDGFPAWDLVLLGMGDDAHTASLFPETKALDEQERWFVENWVEKFSAYRYTLTAPAINSGREIWFLITGAAKRDALARVLGDRQAPQLYPSQLIRPTHFFITADAMPADEGPAAEGPDANEA